MPIRLLYVATALLVGLLAVLLLDLALGAAGDALAQELDNCPEGFHWERMSGQCCVQDFDTIPEHGLIGYTGNSICDEGYTGVYERLPTKNREGVAGCPNYASFAFLEECLKKDSGAGGAIGGGGLIRDASQTLYGGGGGLSKEELAALGAGAATVAAAGSALRGGRLSGRARMRQLADRLADANRQLEEAVRELEEAREAREKLLGERKLLEAVIDAAQLQEARLKELMAIIDAYRNRLRFTRNYLSASALLFALAGALAAIKGVAALRWAIATSLTVSDAAKKATLLLHEGAVNAILRAGMSVYLWVTQGMGSIQDATWLKLKQSFADHKAKVAIFEEKMKGELNEVQKKYDAAQSRVEEASTRVADLRSWRTRIAQQMQLALQGQ